MAGCFSMYRLKQNQHWYCKYYGSYDAVFINPLARNYYLCKGGETMRVKVRSV